MPFYNFIVHQAIAKNQSGNLGCNARLANGITNTLIIFSNKHTKLYGWEYTSKHKNLVGIKTKLEAWATMHINKIEMVLCARNDMDC